MNPPLEDASFPRTEARRISLKPWIWVIVLLIGLNAATFLGLLEQRRTCDELRKNVNELLELPVFEERLETHELEAIDEVLGGKFGQLPPKEARVMIDQCKDHMQTVRRNLQAAGKWTPDDQAAFMQWETTLATHSAKLPPESQVPPPDSTPTGDPPRRIVLPP